MTRSIRFPGDLFEQLEQVAEREDRTVNSLVVHLVRRGIGLYQGPRTLPVDQCEPIAPREVAGPDFPIIGGRSGRGESDPIAE